jgi:hypothetical protein
MMMMMMMMTAIMVMTRGREECEHLPMSRTWRKISVARLSWRVEQAPYPMSKNTAMDTHTRRQIGQPELEIMTGPDIRTLSSVIRTLPSSSRAETTNAMVAMFRNITAVT